MRTTASLLLALFFFSGCYSYRVASPGAKYFQAPAPTQTVFIVNPELTKEKKILEQSGLFLITSDANDSFACKLRLEPLKRIHIDDGPGIFVSLFTAGQLPVIYQDRFAFEFTIFHHQDSLHQSIPVGVNTRYWFWDLFAFKKNFAGKAGKTLCFQYYQASATAGRHSK